MTVFEFVEIKKELIATLEGETDDTGALVTDVKYAEGTVRSRKDGDYRKQGGKWVKIYSGEGRGASLAVTHAVKKIKAAQSVDELMDLVNANISRFYDKNGKLLPVVARLRDAVNESKTRINTERKAKEGEKQTQESKTTGEERTENAESEQKTISKSRAEMQKRYAEIMDEKFKILKEFKEELQKFPKFDMSELDRLTIEIKKETKKRKPNNERLKSLNKALEAENARVEDYYRKYDLYKEKLNSELDKKIATLDSEKIKLKKEMDKTTRFPKKEDAPKTQTLSDEDKKQPSISEIMKFIFQNQDKVFDEVEKRKGADSKYQELERVEKEASATKRELEKKFLKDRKEGNTSALKEDKKALKEATENYQKASDASLSYEAELQKQIATQLMTEKPAKSTKQGYDNRQTQIDDYIKANGTPDIVKNGFWNGKVYGSEKSGYSVYIDGKKKTLSEADKKQFGLK